MPDDLLLIGAGVGITIAAPVGPVSLLCIRQAFERGFRAALATGLGAAVADTVAGSLAAFGLHAVALPSEAWQRCTRLGLAVALALLGMQAWRTASRPQRTAGPTPGFGTALALTLLNPLNVAAFAGLLTGLGLAHLPVRDAVVVAAGVAVGVTLWWTAFAAFAVRLRVDPRRFACANRLIAVLLACAAGGTAASAIVAGAWR